MKLIYVGTLSTTPDRDSGWIHALRGLGHEVIAFSSQYDVNAKWFIGKIERRLNSGPGNRHMQAELLSLTRREAADWVHFRLPLEFDGETIEQIRAAGTIVTQYFNDDPFSPKAVPLLSHKFKSAMSLYDGHFVYRVRNVEDYLRAGARNVFHCPPCYNPAVHFLEGVDSPKCFSADAAFIGHWEDDGRCEYLDALIAAGFKVIVKGGMWDRPLRKRPGRPIARLAPIVGAYGGEYRLIYSSALAGVCFFSKINQDELTERVFEIIAVGGLLVCERTEEAMSCFEDRKEAMFFSSIHELIEIVHTLKNDHQMRESIRAAGQARLVSDGNTIIDRAQQVSQFVMSFRNAKQGHSLLF